MSAGSPRCGATIGEVQCQLPDRHNSPHEHGDADGKTTWEPSYVGDLRYELKHGPHMWRALLSDVIDDIGPSLHSEARDARDNTMGAERQLLTAGGWVDMPSRRDIDADDPDAARKAERAAGSGVSRGGWELTHAAARRWADRNVARSTT